MKFTLKEMNGLLNGKCLPSDLIVGETLAEYLVRKFSELEQKLIESERYGRQTDITIDNLEMKLAQMAAENAGLKAALNPKVIPDAAVEAFNETAIMDHDWNETSEWSWVENDTDVIRAVLESIKPDTPATDAFLAEVRASAIPEGYVLVPQQIFLEPSDIESICSQCGDGHESGYGDFTDGLLWVGNIQRDDGSIVHGLHISSADYSEEGGVTVCEFAALLRKGVQS
ncbi:hNH endonuclease [Enterobacter asburiae]|uniref:hNH endonuclease n=1 Tax=Enterobacter asburiae TaxID=61645 RepID=UPI001F47E3D4|nr:hNH endonuclease [Enterobacter asburiae]